MIAFRGLKAQKKFRSRQSRDCGCDDSGIWAAACCRGPISKVLGVRHGGYRGYSKGGLRRPISATDEEWKDVSRHSAVKSFRMGHRVSSGSTGVRATWVCSRVAFSWQLADGEVNCTNRSAYCGAGYNYWRAAEWLVVMMFSAGTTGKSAPSSLSPSPTLCRFNTPTSQAG